MTPLAELLTEHAARSTPLIDLGAYFIYHGEKTKRHVKPSWKMATKTFNDLGPAWVRYATWYAAAAVAEGSAQVD